MEPIAGFVTSLGIDTSATGTWRTLRPSADRIRSRAPSAGQRAATTVRVADTEFETFYRTHRDRIVRAVGLTIGDLQLAADATSEAMITAHQRWAEVARYGNPAGWTYRVALNHARGWRRTMLRRRTVTVAAPDDAPTDDQPVDTDLEELLDTLSVSARSVVVCRLYLDWSTDETAAALEIAPGTVKSRLARALAQLRAALEADPSGPETRSET